MRWVWRSPNWDITAATLRVGKYKYKNNYKDRSLNCNRNREKGDQKAKRKPQGHPQDRWSFWKTRHHRSLPTFLFPILYPSLALLLHAAPPPMDPCFLRKSPAHRHPHQSPAWTLTHLTMTWSSLTGTFASSVRGMIFLGRACICSDLINLWKQRLNWIVGQKKNHKYFH